MLLSNEASEQSMSIEMTPLIDVMFLLLIFFLVATTFHQEERELQIALPYAESAEPISATLREIVINVDREGQIIVAGRPHTTAALRELIERRVQANAEQKVAVRGDRETAYMNVMRVLDICKVAGIQEPYLDAILEE